MTESISAYDDYIGDCLFIMKQMQIEPDADTRDKLRELYRYSDGDRFIYRRPEEAVRAYKEAL